MRGDVLASHSGKFAKTHQDISCDGRVAIVGLGDKHAENGEGIWLDESLGRADEESEEAGTVLAIAPGEG